MTRDAQTPLTPEETEAVIREFKRRRQHERLNGFLVLVGEGVIMIALLWYGARRNLPIENVLWVMALFFGVMIGAVIFTQRNWRCPACDSPLSGWKVRINSWFPPEPLHCPYCQAKLL